MAFTFFVSLKRPPTFLLVSKHQVDIKKWMTQLEELFLKRWYKLKTSRLAATLYADLTFIDFSEWENKNWWQVLSNEFLAKEINLNYFSFKISLIIFKAGKLVSVLNFFLYCVMALIFSLSSHDLSFYVIGVFVLPSLFYAT